MIKSITKIMLVVMALFPITMFPLFGVEMYIVMEIGVAISPKLGTTAYVSPGKSAVQSKPL